MTFLLSVHGLSHRLCYTFRTCSQVLVCPAGGKMLLFFLISIYVLQYYHRNLLKPVELQFLILQEQYWAPPDFKRLLSAKLKYLTANGRLIKVNIHSKFNFINAKKIVFLLLGKVKNKGILIEHLLSVSYCHEPISMTMNFFFFHQNQFGYFFEKCKLSIDMHT